MNFRSALTAFVLAALCSSCFSGNQNSASVDLQAAFQGGCSTNGPALELVLSQTQQLLATVQNLRSKNQCAGLDQAFGNVDLDAQIHTLQKDPTSVQLNGLAQAQSIILAQINGTTDPNALSVLTETYASNAVEQATLQGQEAALAGSGMSTRLQLGYSQIGKYFSGLEASRSSIVDCARDNPLFGAQMAAQLMSVSGSFLTPQVGTALAVGGAVLQTMFGFIQDKQYSDAINDLNLNTMTTSLSCGLESLSNSYCQAQDMTILTQLEECGYNPNASPDCPQQKINQVFSSTGISPGPVTAGNGSTVGPTSVQTTPFWQGLDSLSRSLPALQIWIRQVVAGVPPADIYDSNRINDPKNARAAMDSIGELASGWETQETSEIAKKTNSADKHLETVNALSSLVSILAYGSKNSGGCPFSGNCSASAILNYYQSTSAILYNLVGQPMNCVAAIGGGGTCLDATAILLPGDTMVNGVRVNGDGGWATIVQNEQLLFQGVYKLVDDLVHAVLDIDPTSILEAAKHPAGEGLPSPLAALANLSAFLQASHDLYSTVPANQIEGGEQGRQGTLLFIQQTKDMLDKIANQIFSEAANKDADKLTVKAIYDELNLEQDPNFVSARLTLHVQEDINTRIRAGQIPRTAADILTMSTADPATLLSAVPPSQIENTVRSLGSAKSVAQLNVQSFVRFYAPALNNVLKLLNDHANDSHEPQGGSPITANFRSQMAQICILIASTQSEWPSGLDVNLCKGTFYKSDLTGESLAFDDLYAKMDSGESVAGRICSFYDLNKHAANYTREKPH